MRRRHTHHDVHYPRPVGDDVVRFPVRIFVRVLLILLLIAVYVTGPHHWDGVTVFLFVFGIMAALSATKRDDRR